MEKHVFAQFNASKRRTKVSVYFRYAFADLLSFQRALLLRLYNDDSPLIDHSKERFNKPKEDTGPSTPESKPESKPAENGAAPTSEDTMEPASMNDPTDKVDDEVDGAVEGGAPVSRLCDS
jgi:hypothetical protein